MTFLGEFDIDLEETPFANYNSFDWAMYYIEQYGQDDGAHYKAWVLDQISRIYHGTKPIIKLAKWSDGSTNYRVNLEEPPTAEYTNWVEERRGNYNENEDCYEYSYDYGVP
jgi:hypothetical protein